jgi:hypothetical protein
MNEVYTFYYVDIIYYHSLLYNIIYIFILFTFCKGSCLTMIIETLTYYYLVLMDMIMEILEFEGERRFFSKLIY